MNLNRQKTYANLLLLPPSRVGARPTKPPATTTPPWTGTISPANASTNCPIRWTHLPRHPDKQRSSPGPTQTKQIPYATPVHYNSTCIIAPRGNAPNKHRLRVRKQAGRGVSAQSHCSRLLSVSTPRPRCSMARRRVGSPLWIPCAWCASSVEILEQLWAPLCWDGVLSRGGLARWAYANATGWAYLRSSGRRCVVTRRRFREDCRMVWWIGQGLCDGVVGWGVGWLCEV